MAEITTNQVWVEIEKQVFAVLGMVSAQGQARTAGIVYLVRDRKLYIASQRKTWKVRHIAQNPHVSLTVPIHKSIPLIPWIKVPAATVTFSGTARVLALDDVPAEIVQGLFKGLKTPAQSSAPYAIIEVTPEGQFVTYGVGVSLMGMRDTENARGRAPV